MTRWPDNPRLISLARLAELEREHAPGTLLAQKKLDGRRRIISKRNGVYTWLAKDRDGAYPVSTELKNEFESFGWPDGITLDCEWMGPRSKGSVHELYIFDLIGWSGEWVGHWPFDTRYDNLSHVCRTLPPREHVHVLKNMPSPGLTEKFQELLTQESCEGLVIRAHDHRHIGGVNKCVEAKSGFWKIKFAKGIK